ncbi:hypothetical protein KL905_001580 [Ogataea polymorpha]|nr:hypothetical protein KL908_000575 [Ogataea polymorpha]KAG7903019.1 hypothetical protein KL935_000551 [Ogataea polymorpha]KAG7923314.1 hypothetical protein KL905_001580 [Ogataea polymorpha]KAG7929170.1 hypothetical protein KL925_001351 [Ogataea polymorpha]
MDAIADRAFAESQTNPHKLVDETPSLLAVVVDINPLEWRKLEKDQSVSLKQVVSSVIVMLNSHLSLNSSNHVAMYLANSYSHGAQLIYPLTESSTSTRFLHTPGMYRQFRFIDGSIVDKIEHLLNEQPETLSQLVGREQGNQHIKGTLAGAMSMALCHINKIQQSDELNALKSRLLVVSISDDSTLPYVSVMNTIFASQKMKISVDVCKLGPSSTFLQQAADATNGVYIYITQPEGLIQYLTTALFIDPMLRPIIVLPTDESIDFRASCFITNKVIDVGYVCSVCLCILSVIPEDEKCPTCHSKFDHSLITKLKRKPKVLPLKKKDRELGDRNGAAAPESA